MRLELKLYQKNKWEQQRSQIMFANGICQIGNIGKVSIDV